MDTFWNTITTEKKILYGTTNIMKKIPLTKEEINSLEIFSKSRICSYNIVLRSKILLLLSQKMTYTEISKILQISTKPIFTTYKRYQEKQNIEYALNDRPRSGRKRRITLENKLIVINLACTKPKEFGFASEL